MRALRLGLALGVCLVLATAGCRTRPTSSYTPVMRSVPVVGPHASSAAAFDRVHGAMHAAGYAPDVVEPHAGRISAPARFRDPRGPLRVVVQLYRDGWVRVSAEGRAVADRGARIEAPAAMWDEIAELAIVLDRELAAAAAGSGRGAAAADGGGAPAADGGGGGGGAAADGGRGGAAADGGEAGAAEPGAPSGAEATPAEGGPAAAPAPGAAPAAAGASEATP